MTPLILCAAAGATPASAPSLDGLRNELRNDVQNRGLGLLLQGVAGFDRSGSIYYFLRHCGLEPPRTSSTPYDWIKDAGQLVEIPAQVDSLDADVFDTLQPGDLLFWAGRKHASLHPRKMRGNRDSM